MAKTTKTIKFEEALSKLEGAIEKLESGQVSLDESLKTFEEGIEMAKLCESQLNEAEGKVELLVKNMEEKSKLKAALDEADALED